MRWFRATISSPPILPITVLRSRVRSISCTSATADPEINPCRSSRTIAGDMDERVYRRGAVCRTVWKRFDSTHFSMERYNPGAALAPFPNENFAASASRTIRNNWNIADDIVRLQLIRAANVCIDLFSLKGSRRTNIYFGHLTAGQHAFSLKKASLPPGIYLASITEDKVTSWARVCIAR